MRRLQSLRGATRQEDELLHLRRHLSLLTAQQDVLYQDRDAQCKSALKLQLQLDFSSKLQGVASARYEEAANSLTALQGKKAAVKMQLNQSFATTEAMSQMHQALEVERTALSNHINDIRSSCLHQCNQGTLQELDMSSNAGKLLCYWR